MREVFHFIIQSSLYAGIVGLVIILIKLLLKNKLSARYIYETSQGRTGDGYGLIVF